MSLEPIIIAKKCNNHCLVCYIKKDSFCNNPSLNEILNRLKRYNMRKQEINIIDLSGGEPTLNKNLFKILKDIRRLFPATEIALLTNGRLFFYKNYVEQFVDLNIKNIKVTIPLHAHTPSLHDFITQVKGSFEQTTQGIKNLLDRNIWVELRVIINKFNYRYLKDLSFYILTNFSNILYLVFIAMNLSKNVLENKVIVTYTEFVPYLKEAIERINNRLRIKLYHFPLCIIDSKYWGLIYKSIEEYKLIFLPQCNGCLYKRKCMGVLKTYTYFVGNKEFMTIRKVR